MRLHPLRLVLAAFLALPLILTSGCDIYEDDEDELDDDDIAVVEFSFDGDDASISEDDRIASFDTDDVTSSSDRAAVEDALDGADEGAVVLLYADGGLLFEGGEGTWTALPVTRGLERLDTGGAPYVEYTLTYSYSYDDADLYFDVLSSIDLDTLTDEEYAVAVPGQIDLRLVTVREGAFLEAQAAGVDFQSYEAVRRAFALPE